jgi:O-antigen ligase
VAWGARASAASTLVLGAALAGVAFGAAGGTELTRTTSVEVLLVVASGAMVAVALLYALPAKLHGGAALTLFAALAAFTALAVLWSVVPELTYVEAGRTLAYLAVFAAGMAIARLAPRAAPVVLGGILLAATAAVLDALAARIWPATIAATELSNRIGQPFQYWNAVGTVGALIVPLALWLGSRRSGSALLRAAAYPAMGVGALAILLTQSRGALLAALVGGLLWFLLVPLRLRSLPVLLLGAAAAGGVGAWALSKDAFSRPLQPLAVKESVAGEFGLLVALLIVGLLLAGLVVNVGMGRGLMPIRARRPLGLAAVLVACVVPLALVSSVAFSDRGLGGTVRDRVDELTSETDTAPAEGAGRITAASNTRGKYWREAGRVFAEREVVGTGPGTFRIARLRERTDTGVTAHAHGFVPQTLADMGLVGLVLTTGLLLAWLVAALRTTSLYPRRLLRRRAAPTPRRDWDGDRIALVTLLLVAVVFGVQSAIDWTWFIPGAAALALVAAGYVAGRGPAAALGAATRRRSWRPSLGRFAVAGGVVVLTLLCAWAIWQPEASDRASNAALDLIDAGRFDAAAAKARDAADTNPLSPRPLFVEAAAQAGGGDPRAAARTLERAVLRYPGDPETWLRLGRFQLESLDDPRAALSTVRGALYLDPRSTRAGQLFLDARQQGRADALVRAQRTAD